MVSMRRVLIRSRALTSAEASYVTGACLVVDGGLTAQE
jgi:NAD(P)-dependent dehydrogenase (short-subunit alcohol dehydrogenase family)